MGYERRSRSFNFMGAVPVGKTFQVVPEEQETPVVIAWPPKGRGSVGGTVALLSGEFERGLRTGRCRLVSR